MIENSIQTNLQFCFISPGENLRIDVSNCPLIEVINKMVAIKSKLSSVYAIHYTELLYHLRSVESEFKCTLFPSFVTDVFWDNFIPYLFNKGLAPSTVRLLCYQLKMSIEWAGRHGARISSTYNDWTAPSYTKSQISLSPDEVSHIYHFDIDSIPRRQQYKRTLKQVRDMFVLSCNLGQRYSDMSRIDISCFHDNIFLIRQHKTGIMSRVDMGRMTIDKNTTFKLLKKYDYMPPYQGCYCRFNQYLHTLLEYIGKEFIETVRQDFKINGKIETRMLRKCDLITSHTARRTFITNNVLRGYPITDIMRASGHKTYSTFALYLCDKDE